jgi:hypothetical protein
VQDVEFADAKYERVSLRRFNKREMDAWMEFADNAVLLEQW